MIHKCKITNFKRLGTKEIILKKKIYNEKTAPQIFISSKIQGAIHYSIKNPQLPIDIQLHKPTAPQPSVLLPK